jgi:hypothetical protein
MGSITAPRSLKSEFKLAARIEIFPECRSKGLAFAWEPSIGVQAARLNAAPR